LRKKIIGMSVVLMALAMLCAQTIAAVTLVEAYAWTDKPWYNPGDSGKLKISIINPTDKPVEIRNITILYPWGPQYDANTGTWDGNVTIKISPAANMPSGGGKYYTEQDFTIPNDGRSRTGYIHISVWTTNGTLDTSPLVQVAGATTSGIAPIQVLGLTTWMTSLTVVIVICTIILAIVVFLSTRGRRAPRVIASSPPPPKSKAA
jgi:hypothetical protein